MIEEERSPALRRRAPASGHVLGYRGLGYVDAELEEFSMDARSAPERICQAHLADQLPNFERHLGPADSSSRFPAPEHAKTSAMPAQNRLRLDDREGIQNTRRDPIQAYENQAIEAAQDRPLRRPSVQYIQLMAQGQVLCPKRCSRPEQPDEHPPDQIEQVPHAPFMARFEFLAKRTGFTTATPTQEVCVGWTSIMANSRNRCCRVGPQRSELRAPISRLPRTYCLP